jgi:hypothetical protein
MDFAGPDQISPEASEVCVMVVGVAFFSLVVFALLRMRRASKSARAARVSEALADKRELAPGFAVVHGEVETEGTRPAVILRIYQLGRELRGRIRVRHTWTEFGRQVDAPPFFLRLASGQRVRVVPGDSARLVDELGVEPLVVAEGAAQQRLLTARLSPSAFAYVCGTLEAPASAVAYRGVEEDWTLHPLAGRQMVISPRPLSPSYTRRARFHMAWAIGCAVALLFANGASFGAYWLELLWGRPVAARATEAPSWTTPGKPFDAHYGVTAEATVDGRDLKLTREASYYHSNSIKEELAKGQSADVYFLVVPFHVETYDLGTRPTVQPWAIFLALLVFGAAAGIYVVHAQRTLAWYDRRRLVDAGKGPLSFPDTPV